MKKFSLLLVALIVLISCKSEAVSSKPGKGNYVELTTNFGPIIIELNPKKAPVTVRNFLSYVDSGYYDGTIFHRVIDGFMIQGGGFDEKMNKKNTNKPIKNEAKNGLSNVVGTIAMARTNDPHSATSQFFINVANNTFLNYSSDQQPGYCVFGRVVEGIGVVQKIKGVSVSNFARYQNVPDEPVIIKRARRFTKDQLADEKGVESLKETPLPVATN